MIISWKYCEQSWFRLNVTGLWSRCVQAKIPEQTFEFCTDPRTMSNLFGQFWAILYNYELFQTVFEQPYVPSSSLLRRFALFSRQSYANRTYVCPLKLLLSNLNFSMKPKQNPKVDHIDGKLIESASLPGIRQLLARFPDTQLTYEHYQIFFSIFMFEIQMQYKTIFTMNIPTLGLQEILLGIQECPQKLKKVVSKQRNVGFL